MRTPFVIGKFSGTLFQTLTTFFAWPEANWLGKISKLKHILAIICLQDSIHAHNLRYLWVLPSLCFYTS